MKHALCLACSLLCASLAAPLAHATPHYRLTNLGVLSGYQASYATCLNDRGQVAGNMTSSLKPTTAFLWKNGCLYKMPFIADPRWPVGSEAWTSNASGINNRGQVVGTFGYDEDGAWLYSVLRAFVWDRQGAHQIPFPAPYDQSTAAAINDAGQVAYTADDEEPSQQGKPFIFLFSKGRSIFLGSGTATGINKVGEVSGYVTLDRYREPVAAPADYGMNPDAPSPAVSYALLCQPRHVKRTLGLGYALNVNDSSNAIGISTDMTLGYKGWNVAGAEATSRMLVANVLAAQRAEKLKTTLSGPEVLWRNGHGRSQAVTLPFHWLPQAINSRGWIVGSHFLWARVGQYDLNTLIGRVKGWKIVCATAINNRDDVAGWGYRYGKPRAFLLTPKQG